MNTRWTHKQTWNEHINKHEHHHQKTAKAIADAATTGCQAATYRPDLAEGRVSPAAAVSPPAAARCCRHLPPAVACGYLPPPLPLPLPPSLRHTPLRAAAGCQRKRERGEGVRKEVTGGTRVDKDTPSRPTRRVDKAYKRKKKPAVSQLGSAHLVGCWFFKKKPTPLIH